MPVVYSPEELNFLHQVLDEAVNSLPVHLRTSASKSKVAKRILDSGWSIVYEPEAAVYHAHDFPVDVLFRRYFDIGVVYQRLGIWNDRSRASLWREGWGAFKGKLSLLLEKERPESTGSSLIQDIGKYAAIQLGRNERLLPRAVKKKLSLYRLFD